MFLNGLPGLTRCMSCVASDADGSGGAAIEVLQALLNPLHGDPGTAAAVILRLLASGILAVPPGAAAKALPAAPSKPMLLVRERLLAFITSVLR